MRIEIDTTIEIWQIHSVDGKLFANLDTEPGLLRFDVSVIGGRVLAVLAWVTDFETTEYPDAVVLTESTERLEEFLSEGGYRGAHWKVLWRSDEPIVAPVKFRFRGNNNGDDETEGGYDE